MKHKKTKFQKNGIELCEVPIERNNFYSRLKLSKRACKSASASDGVTAPLPPFPPAPTAAACGALLPVATDNDPAA